MGEGHDHLKLLQDALTKFENAVVEREKHKLLESKIARREREETKRKPRSPRSKGKST